MQGFKRFLMSQHFGQVEARVELDGLPGGTVSLSGNSLKDQPLQFEFSTQALKRVFGDAVDWKEMVIRLAVSQAHKMPDRPAEQGRIPLEVEAPPWLGDLTSEPYAGATYGVGLGLRRRRVRAIRPHRIR